MGLVPLVGRRTERGVLERWLVAVAAGRAGLGLVEGEAGIGKSRVAGVVCELAAGLSFTVFTAAADELDRGRPFGVLGDALGFVAQPPGGAASAPGLEYLLVDQLVERVEEASLQRPVVIVLEDLHWTDPATVVALRALGRRLAHLPIAMLATFRPSPRPIELDRLIATWKDDGALHLRLAPLEHESVIDLAAELVGGRPGDVLQLQLAAAAGNPLFVIELLGALVEDGAIELVDGVAMLRTPSLPPSLRLTILRRVAALGDSAVKLLRTASVLGTTFSPLDLATVTGRPVTVVVDELIEARRAGVVEDVGALLRFRHALVREALYGDLPEGACRALHRHAGRLLADAGAPALQVAEQLSLGASPGDREAVRWLRDAAGDSLSRAPQTAVSLLERAVELAPVGNPARDQLLADLADALLWSGRPGQGQSRAADLLARGVPSPIREQARGTVVRGLWLDGRWRALLEQIDRWIELTGPGLPDQVRGRWLADGTMAAVFSGDAERAEVMGREALEIAESLGDATLEFQALYALGPVHNYRGRKDQELEVSERALAIVEGGQNPDLARFHPHFAVGMAFAGQDRHDEAEQMFMTGMRVREELGTVWDLALYPAGLAEIHCETGKWDDALVEADTGLAIAEEIGTRPRVLVCLGVAALIHAHRGNLAEAGRYLKIAEEEIERSGPQAGAYWAILAAAQLAEAHGDHDRTLQVLRDAWTANEHSPGLRVYLAPALVRAALATDEPVLARSAADTASSYPRPSDVASAAGHALLARGTVDRDSEVLARAVEMLRRSGWVHALGIACETSAIAIALEHHGATARPLFEEALDIYERLDARRDTARTLATMRACGLRRGSRAAHRRALKGWESLTATESDVVRLTVEGLTNRQIGERLFISRRTVQTHLAHAFAKLEVGSRVELAAAAQHHTAA